MKQFLASLALLLLFANNASAGGFFLTDRGTVPLGRGFALVAGAEDAQAIWYNPGALSNAGQSFLLDTTMTFFRGDFTRIDAGGNALPNVEVSAPPLPLPMLAYTHPVGNFTLGLGIFAPNAALLSWPRGVRADESTCDAHSAEGMADPTCQAAPQRYSLYSLDGSAFVNIAPAAAYRFSEHFSLGVSLPILVGAFAGETALSACDGFVCSHPEDPEWDGVAHFELSPIVQPGISLGVLFQTSIVRVGLSGTWWPGAVRGDAKLSVRLPTAPNFDGAHVDGDEATISMPFPIVLRGGIEVRPHERVAIEAALVYESWSLQESATITPSNVWIRDAVAIGDYQVGPINLPRQMRDTYSVRLGTSIDAIRDRLTVHLGGSYENGSFADEYLTPLTLDSDKVTLGGGISVAVSSEVTLDLSYAHVFMTDRQVRTSLVPQSNPIRPARPDGIPPNEGGAVYVGNGDYGMEADILGLGLRWRADE